jgi:hypothetical protein
LDKDLIELELFGCDLVGSQLVRTKGIPKSIEVERLDSESYQTTSTVIPRENVKTTYCCSIGPFLGIRSPERHAELQVLDERSRPARVLLSSLFAFSSICPRFVEGLLTFKIRHMRFPSVTPTGQ